MAKDFFEQLRDAPQRKPSWKRSQQDAKNYQDMVQSHQQREYDRNSQRGPESDIEDIDWGVDFEERKGK